jgi:hypothetical protein
MHHKTWDGVNTFTNLNVCDPKGVEVNLRYHATNSSQACSEPLLAYYSDNTNLLNMSGIWSNNPLMPSNYAAAGFYSDASIIREWNGSAWLGQTNCFTTYPLTLGYGLISSPTAASDACAGTTLVTVYLDTPSLLTATLVWTDPWGNPAFDGVYAEQLPSNQISMSRQWDGVSVLSPSINCPAP